MSYTPFQWNAILAPDRKWQDAYAGVEEAAKELLRPSREPVTTNDLVELLYPAAQARGEGITARKRIFKALEGLSKHGLKRYWEPGEARSLKHNKGKLVVPKFWRAPPALKRYSRVLDPARPDTFDMVEADQGAYVLYSDIEHLL